jgi:hypothetical protein
MDHQEDVENIQSLVYNSLKPLMRKGEKRFIRVQISYSLFVQLKNNNITGRFKDATHLVELLNIPTVYQVETGRSSGMRMFQARVSKAKKNGQYSSKPWITIRFIRCNLFE